MPSTELDKLLATARSKGWVVAQGNLRALEFQVLLSSSWKITKSTPDKGPIVELRPKPPEAAPRSSLSAKYGLGSFPLHTDGATLRQPPEFVLLENGGPAGVAATSLRRHRRTGSGLDADAWALGTFQVGWGPDSFLAPASTYRWLRFDPGCMQPLDRHAEAVAQWLMAQEAEHTHEWSDEAEVLIIHNREVLHGRQAVEDGSERVLRRMWIDRSDK